MSERIIGFAGTPMGRRDLAIAREAFREGVRAVQDFLHGRLPADETDLTLSEVAAKRYPPPPSVMRPRIVADPLRDLGEYKVDALPQAITTRKTAVLAGTPVLWYRRDASEQWDLVVSAPPIDPLRMQVWNDLFANPTEEADAE